MFKNHIAVALFLIIVAVNFSLKAEQSTSELFDKALSYEKEGKAADAKPLYDEIVAKFPSSPEFRRAKVRIARFDTVDLIHNGNYGAAFAKIDQIITDYNDCSDIVWFLYSAASTCDEVNDKVERREDAIRLYDMAAARDSASKCGISATIKGARLRTLSLIDAGHYDEADIVFSKVVEKYPNHNDLKWCIFSVASRYDELNERSKAMQYYDMYVQHFGKDSFGVKATIKRARINALNAIDRGEVVLAVADIKKLFAEYSQDGQWPWCIYSCACRLDERGYSKEAEELYKWFSEVLPEDKFATSARVKAAKIAIVDCIDNHKYEQAEEQLKSLTQQYGGHPDYPGALLAIGAGYYKSAVEADGGSEFANNLQRAIAIYTPYISDAIAGKLPDASSMQNQSVLTQDIMSEMHILAGDCFNKLGEYNKSIACYKWVIVAYPGYKNVWHAQFMIGRTYEKMLQAGIISQSQAGPLISSAYKTVLEKYPDCGASRAARQRLAAIGTNAVVDVNKVND